MIVVIEQLAKCTIEDFADAHDLVMLVTERNVRRISSDKKYYARFDGAEDKEDSSSGTLESTYGNGGSPDEAIRNYAYKISGRVLIFNAASKKDRLEIQCPIFIN
jgi:hypothetical protein